MDKLNTETVCFTWRKQILNNYIKNNNLRATSERFHILECIHEINNHFTVQELFDIVNKKHAISRATLYNNIDIFIDCKLLIKHQFSSKEYLYEKNTFKNHYHLICKCGKITELSNPKVLSLISDIKKSVKGVDIKSYSFNLYGECESCPESTT